MSRRVVFLDFDGVVVIRKGPREKRDDGTPGPILPHPDLVARLNGIVATTGAEVVVSSTWRMGREVSELAAILEASGFVGRVVDKTPWGVDGRHVERGHEIHAWLGEHPDVTSFVVLDDDNDRGPLTQGRWLVVKGGFDSGLSDEDVRAAIRVLMTPVYRGAAR